MHIDRVLLIEDDASGRTARKLREVTADLLLAGTLAEAVSHLGESEPVDAVVVDLDLPDSQGVATLEALMLATAAPVVVLTSVADEDTAREAVRLGAQDYVMGDTVEASGLHRALAFAIDRSQGESRERFLGRPSLTLHSDMFTRTGWETLLHKEEQRCARYGNQAGVLVISVDGDQRAAETTDLLLHHAAAEISLAVRACDVVCQLSDETFGVLLVECEPGEIRPVADRVFQHLGNHGIPVSVGVGERTDQHSLQGAAQSAEHDMERERERHKALADDAWAAERLPLS